MDRWEKSLRKDRNQNRRENPSFSSTLLDAIYRSIDENNGGEGEEEVILYRESMRKKKHSGEEQEEMEGFRRSCMIEKWMEKKIIVRRKSMADFDRKSRSGRESVLLNLSSSSSDSSSNGGFSSSESESIYGNSRSKSSCCTMQKPKPIRTSVSTRPSNFDTFDNSPKSPNPNHENSFVKTKSKALKIYSDLKKVKQPISPGGRLASFLNSLFPSGNTKKAKLTSSVGKIKTSVSGGDVTTPSKSATASQCSSASSFSRSCLSKTPSSRGKPGINGSAKRSVRFYPVSVIVDEDCRPCGHKNLPEEPALMAGASTALRVEEAAREMLKGYQKRSEEFKRRGEGFDNGVEEDDADSYSSSDLFELDNLCDERYCQELPVYETTHLNTNLAIANGLIL